MGADSSKKEDEDGASAVDDTRSGALRIFSTSKAEEDIIKLSAFDNDAVDKTRQEMIVYGYIQRCSKAHDLSIPNDIVRLCLRFFQVQLEWLIDLGDNIDETQVHRSLFEISRLKTDIIATMRIQFEVNKYNSIITIRVGDIKSDKVEKSKSGCRVYCHLKCDAVNFERKYTEVMHSHAPTLCAFSKVPSGCVVLNCYFRILSKPMLPAETFNIRRQATYEWTLTDSIKNEMINNVPKRFYSPNFNEGCFCLSMYNNKIHPSASARKLGFRLILLNDECMMPLQRTRLNDKADAPKSKVTLLNEDGDMCQCELDGAQPRKDNDMLANDMLIDKNFIVSKVILFFNI